MVKNVGLRGAGLFFACYTSLAAPEAALLCNYQPENDRFSCSTSENLERSSVTIFNKKYEFDNVGYDMEALTVISIPLNAGSEVSASKLRELKRGWEVFVYPRKGHKQFLSTPYPFQHDVRVLNKFYSSELAAATYFNPRKDTKMSRSFKNYFSKLLLPKIKESVRGSLVAHSQMEQQLMRINEAMDAALSKEIYHKNIDESLGEATQNVHVLKLKQDRFDGVSPFPILQLASSEASLTHNVKKIFGAASSFIRSEVIKSEKSKREYTSFYRAGLRSNEDPRYIVQYQTTNANGAKTGICIELDEHLHYCTDPEKFSEDKILLVPNKSVKVKLLTMKEQLELEMAKKDDTKASAKGVRETELFLNNDEKRTLRDAMKTMTEEQKKEKEILLSLILFEKSEFIMTLRFLYLQTKFFKVLDEKSHPMDEYFKNVKNAYSSAVKNVARALTKYEGNTLQENGKGINKKSSMAKQGEKGTLFETLIDITHEMYRRTEEGLDTLARESKDKEREAHNTYGSNSVEGFTAKDFTDHKHHLWNLLKRANYYEMGAFLEKWDIEIISDKDFKVSS